MRGFLIRWSVNIIALLAVIHVAPGISSAGLETTVVAALVLGLVNVFLRPLVVLLTLPLNILSLGLFTLVINGFMFYIVGKLVRGFSIFSFWDAFWGAIVFSLVSFLLNLFVNAEGRISINEINYRARHKGAGGRVIDVEGKIEE